MNTQAQRFLVLFVCSILGIYSINAEKQTVTLKTSLQQGETFTLIVGAERDAYIDWGDGTFVPISSDTLTGTVKDSVITIQAPTTWSTLGCDGQKIYSVDLSQAPYLKSIFLSNNELQSLDVSEQTLLTDLDCSHNDLKSLDIKANKKLLWLNCSYNELSSLYLYNQAELLELDCSNNQFEQITFYRNNSQLSSFNCSNNNMSQLSLTLLSSLKSLYCYDNVLTKLSLGVRDSSLEILWCDNNQLEELDIDKCTHLTQVSCTNNKLKSISYPNLSTKSDYTLLSCQNNNLTFKDLITRQNVINYSINYTYSPQAQINVLQTIPANTTLDLTEYRYNASEKYIGTAYKAYTCTDSTALSSTSYSTASGNITFKESIADSVYLVMTSSFYPNLSIYTNPFKVESPVSIQSITTPKETFTVSTSGQILKIECKEPLEIYIYQTDGSLIWKGIVSSIFQKELPKGIYLVNNKKIIL